jgi:hypothetical protein
MAQRPLAQYARFFGLIFVATALPFAVLSALSLAIIVSGLARPVVPIDTSRLLLLAAAAGLAFGLFMSIFGGIGQLLATRHLKAGPARLAVSQTEEVLLDGPTDQALATCAEALRVMPKTKVNEVNPEAHWIRAKRGLSWRSWGDQIRIDVQGNEDHTSLIQVSSRPCLRTTLVDWGSNLRNVAAIREYLVGKGARSIAGQQAK